MSGRVLPLLKRLDLLHLLALVLLSMPLLMLLVFGGLWLWQSEQRMLWLSAMVASIGLAYGLQYLLRRSRRRLLDDAVTEPDPAWPASADPAWAAVGEFADSVQPADWPLTETGTAIQLGRATLERVARVYHPAVDQPLLELTLPHTLMIVERAARDLRQDITEHVPFSHRLKVGDLLRARRWQQSAERVFDLYRAGRVVINPLDALIGEVQRHLMGRSFGVAREELQRWLLQAYVRKIGYYAIDLYSGRLPLDDGTEAGQMTGESSRHTEQARAWAEACEPAEFGAPGAAEGAEAAPGGTREPLRIAVFGRSNAGKSSLVNALFGSLRAVSDAVADTTAEVMPHLLERDGFTQALVFDTPGCDSPLFQRDALLELALQADLILWVSAVNRPDRQQERECLDALQHAFAQRSDRRPPPLIVVASHIDRLRPVTEWQPPYDLASDTPKARNIRLALEAVSADLGLPAERVIPVCTAEGREYNVSDLLWAALLDAQPAAERIRLMRCLEARRRDQDWKLLWRQLKGAGRLLRRLGG